MRIGSGHGLCQPTNIHAGLRRLALHALVFGNARAVAVLWSHFVHELRFRHWETLTPLPHMPGPQPPLTWRPHAHCTTDAQSMTFGICELSIAAWSNATHDSGLRNSICSACQSK